MKSLVESLFGNNIKNELLFGNLFKLTEVTTFLKKPSSGWKTTGRGWRQNGSDSYKLSDIYQYKEIAHDAKVSGDQNDIILKGLEKLILDIPITIDMNNKEFNAKIIELEKYYKPLVNSTRSLKVRSFGLATNQGPDKWKNINDFVIIDTKAIKVTLCCVEFMFERK